MKKYWYVLLNNELLRYGSQNDSKPRERKNLEGIFVRDYAEPKVFDGHQYYCFYLMFPEKRSIFSFASREDKDKWVRAIRMANGQVAVEDMYTIGAELGRGKYGKVFQATHNQTGQIVAIKVISKRDRNEQDLQMFRQESDLLGQCRHPSVLRLHETLESHDAIYIVMECLTGPDLDTFLNKLNYNISEQLALKIFSQLAETIFYLHSISISHNDLKLENIVLKKPAQTEEEVEISLVDFGFSKKFMPGETITSSHGTLGYAAPELLLHKPQDKSVDCWAMGVILYILLSGQQPFDSEGYNEQEVALRTIKQPITFDSTPDLKARWQNVSYESKDLILRMLERDPQKRITIDQIMQHLGFSQNLKQEIPAFDIDSTNSISLMPSGGQPKMGDQIQKHEPYNFYQSPIQNDQYEVPNESGVGSPRFSNQKDYNKMFN